MNPQRIIRGKFTSLSLSAILAVRGIYRSEWIGSSSSGVNVPAEAVD